MARSLSYWEKRKAREAYEMYEEVERAALELNKIYASVSDQIERDARRIFRRFETKFGLSEREAEKLLNTVLDPKDIKTITGLLRRDPKNKDLVAQLESQAYASRINRLAKMQDRVDELTTQILGRAEPAFNATLSEVARGSYYREIFGMQQRANAAFAFSPLTVDRISRVLAANWSGKSYSARLWGNTEALSASVKRELMKGLLMGKSPFRMSQTIEEEFHKGATASRQLMRTEATYVANQMAMEAYKEAGTEKYIYVAILDMRTSEICQSLDKKRFLISSAEVGENYPPMHPWCRSTTIAWMPDEMLKALKQSAIDPATGERIEVPGDMSYETWYNEYVAGKEEEIEQRETEGGRNYTSEQFERYRAYDVGPETYQEFIQAKADPETWEALKLEYRDAKLKQRIRTEYNLTINPEKQKRHIEGNVEAEGRSTLFASEDPQALINQYAGTGIIIRDASGNWSRRWEFIEADHDLGVARSDGVEPEITNSFSISYSKSGTHITPRYKRKE